MTPCWKPQQTYTGERTAAEESAQEMLEETRLRRDVQSLSEHWTLIDQGESSLANWPNSKRQMTWRCLCSVCRTTLTRRCWVNINGSESITWVLSCYLLNSITIMILHGGNRERVPFSHTRSTSALVLLLLSSRIFDIRYTGTCRERKDQQKCLNLPWRNREHCRPLWIQKSASSECPGLS